MSKSERTIRRELKRGMVEHIASDLSKITVYNAEYAQNDANSKNSAKGPPIKLGQDWALVNAVSRLIKKEKYSPYAVIEHFKRTRWPGDTRICEKTLYNYIAAGDISDVTQKDLLYGGKRFKPIGIFSAPPRPPPPQGGGIANPLFPLKRGREAQEAL